MELLTYLLKVSACTVLFFAFYLLVLRRLTFFKTNRFYLLVTLLLSFIIPTLNFTIEREVPAAAVVFDQPTIVNHETEVAQIQIPNQIAYSPIAEDSFDWYSVLPYFYFGIVACLLIIATWRILQLVKHTKHGAERINGLKIVSKTKGFTNCSFFNYVFIDNKNLTEAELQVLLKHEQVHAQQLHSVDKVLLIIAKAFLWFNPVVYLYDKALEQAHEYEADEATSQSFGTEQYANLLLRLAIAKSEIPLVHNFVKSPIKARIKMLFNSKSKNMKKLMYLLAVPVGLGLLWGFTVKVVEVYKSPEIKNEKPVVKEKANLNSALWGKTLKGKVKSILQTEVGEILNFNYGENTIEIFNHAKGKVKVGDELMIKISGTVDDITVNDSKGNVIKKLDRPCYGMSKLINAKGVVLFDLDDEVLKKQISTQLKVTKQDTVKIKKQISLDQKEKYGDLTMYVIKVADYNDSYFKSLAKQLNNDGFFLTAKKSFKNNKLNGLMVTIQSNNNNSSVIWDGNKNTDQAEIVIETNSKTKQYAIKLITHYVEKPRLVSSAGLVVDPKTQISYIKNGVMRISLGLISADEMIWDKTNETLKSKKATLEFTSGHSQIVDSLYYNAKTDKFIVYNVKKGDTRIPRPSSEAYQLLSKLNLNSDSIKKRDIMGTMLLTGKINLNIDKYSLNAKVIKVDRNSNIITAHMASITDANGMKVNGDVIEFDVVSKKATIANPFGSLYKR